MLYCQNCNQYLPDGTTYCPRCGAGSLMQVAPPPPYPPTDPNFAHPPTDPNFSYPPYGNPYQPSVYGSHKVQAGLMVWAIILIVSSCGSLFGILSLIWLLLAKDEFYACEEQKKIKTAKIFNIVGTVVAGLALLSFAMAFLLSIFETFNPTMY